MSDNEVKGWVYLIVNDRHDPDTFFVKIGFTDRDPVERARELVSTGTTGTFVVIYQAYVSRPRRVEHAVHRRLASCRRGGEWFEVCPDRAREEIVGASGGVHYEETTPRWHPAQPAPRDWTRTVLTEAKRAAEENARKLNAAEEEKRREQERREKKARDEADQLRQRQEKEERDARLRAEQERIWKAREEEERRRQNELIWHERRAKWAAKVAAFTEGCSGAATKLGLALQRAFAVILPIGGAGLLFYVVAGPLSDPEMAHRRTRVSEAEATAASLDSERARTREESARAIKDRELLLALRPNLEQKLAAADKLVATAGAELRYSEMRLRDFRQSPPRVSGRGLRDQEQALSGGLAARQQKYREVWESSNELRQTIATLTASVKQIDERLGQLTKTKDDLERRISQHSQGLLVSRRELGEAEQHNRLWTLWGAVAAAQAGTQIRQEK